MGGILPAHHLYEDNSGATLPSARLHRTHCAPERPHNPLFDRTTTAFRNHDVTQQAPCLEISDLCSARVTTHQRCCRHGSSGAGYPPASSASVAALTRALCRKGLPNFICSIHRFLPDPLRFI